MKLLIEMGHPAHVHQFKHFVREMQKRGHSVRIITTDKEVTIPLLNSIGLDYDVIGVNQGGQVVSKLISLAKSFHTSYKISSAFKPDIYISRGSFISGIMSRLLFKPHIFFSDCDHVVFLRKILDPLVDTIISPSSFQLNLGSKHVKIEGYKELMYLHPKYFTPNPAVLKEVGLTEGERFTIIRLVSWHAHHDVGQRGIQDEIRLVKELEPHCRIIISSERPIPAELEKYRMKVSPEKLHDLLYYATLYIGEGATTASECAMLGTHALYVNTLRAGTTDELGNIYGLVHTISDPREMRSEVLNKALKLLNDPDLYTKGKLKRQKLLSEKIDVTAFMIWFIENYPDSMKQIRSGVDVSVRFKTEIKETPLEVL